LLFLALFPRPTSAQAPCALLPASDPPPPCIPPLTRSERLEAYVDWNIGPVALLGAATTTGIAQARNHPSAWGQGMEGYGRRYAHRMAKNFVNNTTRLGIEWALGLDSRYYASPHPETGRRIKHVIRTTLYARTSGGGETLAVGRIAGAFAGGFVSRAWQPEGHRSFRSGLQSGALSFGTDFTSNAFREFWPDLRRHLPF
jgi:hypothetical protein